MGPPSVEARARDLWTATDGTATVVDTARIAARLDGPQHHLVAIESGAEAPGLQALLGAVVGPGFRAKVDRAVPELTGTGALLYLLLDDMPGATLVSGYAMLHAGVVGNVVHDEYLDARGDLCAGWAVDASMMTIIKEQGINPTPLGPEAPPLTDGDDDLAFHPTDAARAVRDAPPAPTRRHGTPDRPVRRTRSRCSSATPTSTPTAWRRSSTSTPSTSPSTRRRARSSSIDPAPTCCRGRSARGPLASAGRLVGQPLADLRPWVRETFVGTSTCTHLNDVLRGVADVGRMIDLIDTAGDARSRAAIGAIACGSRPRISGPVRRQGRNRHRCRVGHRGRDRTARWPPKAPSVTVADLDATRAEAVVDAIVAAGGIARAQAVDVADPTAVAAMVADTVAAYGGLDVLHNNAAAIDRTPSTRTSSPATSRIWERVLAVNLTGPMLGCRFAIPAMLERGGGRHRQHRVGRRVLRQPHARGVRHLEGREWSRSPATWPRPTRDRKIRATRSRPASSSIAPYRTPDRVVGQPPSRVRTSPVTWPVGSATRRRSRPRSPTSPPTTPRSSPVRRLRIDGGLTVPSPLHRRD